MRNQYNMASTRVDGQKLNTAAKELLTLADRVLGPEKGPCDRLRYISQLLLCVPDDAGFHASDVLVRCYEELFGQAGPQA